MPGLLQLPSCQPPWLCHYTPAANTECSCPSYHTIFQSVLMSHPSSSPHRWLPDTAHIKFKTLVLACRAVNGTAPLYLQSILKTYIRARSLCIPQTSLAGSPLPVWLLLPGTTLVCTSSKVVNKLHKVVPQPVESMAISWNRLKIHLFRLRTSPHYVALPSFVFFSG